MAEELVTIAGVEIWLRPGTSDLSCANECIADRDYRDVAINFDVEAGETWLDLGANIGAFAVYCRSRGAKAVCYEPDPDNFRMLRKNVPEFVCHQAVVTASRESTMQMFHSGTSSNHSRNTIIPLASYKATAPVVNVYAGDLQGPFDGIKMDIEGSEAALLDGWLIPPCKKLVMEYHVSRDPVRANLARRLDLIRQHFKTVHYTKRFDRWLTEPDYKMFFDKNIFAME